MISKLPVKNVTKLLKWCFVFLAGIAGYAHRYYYHLFMINGRKQADLSYSIMVNDHGSLIYITSQQDKKLMFLTMASLSSLLIAIILLLNNEGISLKNIIIRIKSVIKNKD